MFFEEKVNFPSKFVQTFDHCILGEFRCFLTQSTPLKRKSTIIDIAAKVGITPSAVSKAFSNHPRISNETKRKVMEAAVALGYQPNSMATGLRKGKSGLIGVVVPGVHYSFFSNAIKGIEELMTEHGYNVVIVQTRDSEILEQKQIDGLIKARVEGIIASLAMNTRDYTSYLNIAKDLPVVLFDRTFASEEISEVKINDFGGAASAVEHLLSMGYRRIAHLAGFKHIGAFNARIEGYKFTLEQAGIAIHEDYISYCTPSIEMGESATDRLLALNEPPDAIFATSDYLAYGAMQAVLKRGKKIPEDIGIVGFSNEAFTQQVTPSISTVDQYSELLGMNAAKILLEHLKDHQKGKSFVSQQMVIEPQLVVRQSSLRKDKN